LEGMWEKAAAAAPGLSWWAKHAQQKQRQWRWQDQHEKR